LFDIIILFFNFLDFNIYFFVLTSREPDILHDKRFPDQANPRFDMIFKMIL